MQEPSLNFGLQPFGSQNFRSRNFGSQPFLSQYQELQHPELQVSGTKRFAAQNVEPEMSRPAPRSPFRIRVFTLAVLALAVLACQPAQAQSTRRPRRESNANRKARIARNIEQTYAHGWEVGGGGGYLRFRPGEFLQKNSEIAFWMNATYFLNPKLGITGEVRGAFGNAKVGNTAFNIPNPQISEYPFLAGPTYRFYRKEKYAISGFALAGSAIGKFDSGSKNVSSANLGLWPSTNAAFAFSAGGNLDLNLYPNIAFRIAPSYLGTTFGSKFQNNVGFEMGVVYRFGHQK
jgi:hypothetical protein